MARSKKYSQRSAVRMTRMVQESPKLAAICLAEHMWIDEKERKLLLDRLLQSPVPSQCIPALCRSLMSTDETEAVLGDELLSYLLAYPMDEQRHTALLQGLLRQPLSEKIIPTAAQAVAGAKLRKEQRRVLLEALLKEPLPAECIPALKKALDGWKKPKGAPARTDEPPTEQPNPTKQSLAVCVASPDEIAISKTVYLNSFLRTALKDFDAYREQAKKAYLLDSELVELSEEGVVLPGWITSDEDKGIYLALRAIYQQGGIYISPAVRVVTSFNREAYQGAFFVAGPEHTVLPCAFGGAAENPLIARILEHAKKESTAWERRSMADCMARTLIDEGGVHLTGRGEWGQYGLHMLSFSTVCRALKNKSSYCVLDYSNYKGTADGMVCLPMQLNDFAWDLAAAQQDAAVRKAKKG